MKLSQLRLSLKLGALYDLVLAVFILLLGPYVFAHLGYRVPDPFLLFIATLPLLILPVLYGTAAVAEDPGPFRRPVLWARGCGGILILLGVLWWKPEAWWIYALIGVVDVVFCGVHYWLWKQS